MVALFAVMGSVKRSVRWLNIKDRASNEETPTLTLDWPPKQRSLLCSSFLKGLPEGLAIA